MATFKDYLGKQALLAADYTNFVNDLGGEDEYMPYEDFMKILKAHMKNKYNQITKVMDALTKRLPDTTPGVAEIETFMTSSHNIGLNVTIHLNWPSAHTTGELRYYDMDGHGGGTTRMNIRAEGVSAAGGTFWEFYSDSYEHSINGFVTVFLHTRKGVKNLAKEFHQHFGGSYSTFGGTSTQLSNHSINNFQHFIAILRSEFIVKHFGNGPADDYAAERDNIKRDGRFSIQIMANEKNSTWKLDVVVNQGIHSIYHRYETSET